MSETLANMEKLGGIDYSTDEQWTGKRWIDGSKIYQKTIDLGNITVTPFERYNISTASLLDNEHIDDIISLRGGYWIDYSGSAKQWHEWNQAFSAKSFDYQYGYAIQYRQADKVLRILGSWGTDSSYLLTKAHVTIQYTKTID